ncbi:MAG: hypothetical protein ACRESG_00205 [Gammaproteobacteria bacterium]
MRIPPRLRPFLPWLALLALLGLVAAAYYPGLSGPFLLDDWANLPALGAYGPVDNPVTLVSYLTSGIAGPTGRPLALASFLMDAHNWPANPWPFKLTNLLLHLLSGALLALLLRQLSRARGLDARRALWIGILGAGMWLAHPLFVSTTLYVVQRMTILAALFVFAGLNCYVWGRARLVVGRRRSGYALMIVGIVGGTFFGMLSKENAALLPLLALVLEWTVLSSSPSPLTGEGGGEGEEQLALHSAAPHPNPLPSGAREQESPSRSPFPEDVQGGEKSWPPPSRLRREEKEKSRPPLYRRRREGGVGGGFLAFRAIFLWLPSLALLAYVLYPLRHALTSLPYRNFTILERLLTEGRVLVDYLYLLVIPHAGTHGLFTSVAVSQNLFHPWTTLPAILIVVALIACAFAVRRRLPVLAAAILFFFAGQLLESTTIPLELFYEHRNYLPAALLFWPLAWWILRGPGARALRACIAGLALALLLALTALRAGLWGNGAELALVWVQLSPHSTRAQVWGSQGLTAAGHPGVALKRLHLATRVQPNDISIALSTLNLACELHRASPADLSATVYAAAHSRAGSGLIYKGVARLAKRIEATPCPPLTTAGLQAIPTAALANPHFAPYPALKQEFLVLRGRLFLRQNKPGEAYAAFAQSLPLDPKPDTALVTAADMYVAHQPQLGLKLLDEYQTLKKKQPHGWNMARLHRWWLDSTGWYSESFKRVRAALEEQQHDAHSPGS